MKVPGVMWVVRVGVVQRRRPDKLLGCQGKLVLQKVSKKIIVVIVGATCLITIVLVGCHWDVTYVCTG